VGQGRSATLEVRQDNDVVRAAGGLVLRAGADGRGEVAVVHRPARADWSFPKGKLEDGESFEDAALREVREETGIWCRLRRFLGHTEYYDRKDRLKVVAYWVMEPTRSGLGPDEVFEANEEVDELRWVSLIEAVSLLSYERDRELLERLELEDLVTGG
jgi:8-oxo-dGTP diphosphatase